VTDAPTRRYRSDLRADQARRTRGRIIAAATATFLSRGYAGASVRAIAAEAGVSVASIELAFGTKASLLKAAIDVAIAGDDEAVPVLDRPWTAIGLGLDDPDAFLQLLASVLAPAQRRSAGLVLAVLEGSSRDALLTELAAQLIAQRRGTAEWIIDTLSSKTPLRPELNRATAVDTLWILMDPAVFDRLVRQCGWPVDRYQTWFAQSARRLLLPDPPPTTDPT
jgi:AcrR family transcriptional regulator